MMKTEICPVSEPKLFSAVFITGMLYSDNRIEGLYLNLIAGFLIPDTNLWGFMTIFGFVCCNPEKSLSQMKEHSKARRVTLVVFETHVRESFVCALRLPAA